MSETDVKLHDPAEFDQRFVDHTGDCQTYEEAYILTEEDYKKVFGKRKYSSYNSFRVSRSKRLKNRKEAV